MKNIPKSVSVNLTNKCNQHCIYCEIGQGLIKDEKPVLVPDDLKWIIDEMSRSGIPVLILGGGEPLLFKDIFDVIRYAYKFKIKCQILTNGMLLPQLSQEEIKLLKACRSAVFVSIDSFSSDKEEYIRGAKNAFSLPIEGIKTLVRHNIPVNIATVISINNYRDLFDVVTNAYRLGVNSVCFQPVIFISNFPGVAAINNKKRLNISPENLADIEDQFQKIMDFEKDNHIRTNVHALRQWLSHYITSISSIQTDDFFFKKVVNRLWCASLYSMIAVNYHGEILPCNMQKSAESIKDRDGKSLVGLWNDACGPARSMIKRQQYLDVCRSCICTFDLNVSASMTKYPFSNFHLIINDLVEKVRKIKIRKARI